MAEYNNANDAAFSKAAFYHPDGGTDSPQVGLTKREYFAAMAMQGLCANSVPGPHHGFERLATESVQYADALLKALDTQK